MYIHIIADRVSFEPKYLLIHVFPSEDLADVEKIRLYRYMFHVLLT